MKKRRGESLTGGTGDVNPQFMHGSAPQTTTDTPATTTVALPVSRIPGADTATVVEVLKVYVDFPQPTEVAVTEADRYATVSFSTASSGTTAILFSDPRTFAQITLKIEDAFTAGGTYHSVFDTPIVFDCTDGAGHGILIATDNIYVQFASTAWNTAAQTAYWKILYRFKEIGLLEYIGIVQSQQ